MVCNVGTTLTDRREGVVMLTVQEMDIIRSTAPVLKEKGLEITSHFYETMFAAHPELLNVFNITHQKEQTQPQALANAVYAAAVHIDQLEKIIPAVRLIAHKHRSVGVKPSQYAIVGEFLLKAIKHVLGDAATPAILGAWEKAYQVLADVFIQMEKEMYQSAGETLADDFVPFTVVKKVVESELITSFYLKPTDREGFVAKFQPGQYISVRVRPTGFEYLQIRQYSLSDLPGKDYFRISVKREVGSDHKPDGMVSNYLHDHVHEGDTIEISAPAGDFTLDQTKDTPVYLISGGVGLTPMQSMLYTLLTNQPERKVTYVHAARNERIHAFKQEVMALNEKHDQLETYINYDEASADQRAVDHIGRLDLSLLPQGINKDADYYICGPKGFMGSMIQQLVAHGVPESKIHYEFFGPAEQMTA